MLFLACGDPDSPEIYKVVKENGAVDAKKIDGAIEWNFMRQQTFPNDGDEEVQSLADSISKNGQQKDIELLDGKILDGRNRWMACLRAGVKPRTVNVNPKDPVAYVLALNLDRRHLDATQQAMVAGRAKEIYEKQAKERLKTKGGHSGPVNLPEASGDARDLAGKAIGVSGKSVDHAVKVLEKGSKQLIEACDSGKVPCLPLQSWPIFQSLNRMRL